LTGVRIDHIDGLYDPGKFCEDTQVTYFLERSRLTELANLTKAQWQAVKPELEVLARKNVDAWLWIVAEAVEEQDQDALKEQAWKAHGTTGYRAGEMIRNVLVDSRKKAPRAERFAQWVGELSDPFKQLQ